MDTLESILMYRPASEHRRAYSSLVSEPASSTESTVAPRTNSPEPPQAPTEDLEENGVNKSLCVEPSESANKDESHESDDVEKTMKKNCETSLWAHARHGHLDNEPVRC